jgi:Double zinc ribbon
MNPANPRKCGSCGEALADGVSFCRACGARYEQPTCNACQAPIAPGTAFCRACGAPVASVPAGAADSEPTQVRPTPPVSPPPNLPQPAREGQRRTPVLIAAVILLLGAGAAAAILLSGGGDSSTTTVSAAADAGEAVPAGGEGEVAEAVEPESENDGFPPVGSAEMEEEIEALLLAYHEDVVERDFQSAWALLSPRKHRQNLAEYGYREWMRAQASLSDYLYPAGLRVRLDALEDEGVARALVTGMGWSAPSSPCTEWSGLTWVRYEHGEWAYDPGYSTTSARRRVWKPRAGELLGANC